MVHPIASDCLIMKQTKHILRFAEINKDTFDFIKSGKKKIETRASTSKYQKIKAGDILVLSCAGKKLEKKVEKVFHFASIKKLLKKYTPNQINPTLHSKKELTDKYYSFPNYKEKIKRFGLIAFEL